LPDAATSMIQGLKEDLPYITGTAIHSKLIEAGVVDAAGTSLTALRKAQLI